MNASFNAFQIEALISSAIDTISSHSQYSAALIDVIIDDRVPGPLRGNEEYLKRAIIIIVERALIQRPHNPITVSCSVVSRFNDLATILISVAQNLKSGQTAPSTEPGDISFEIDPSLMPDEMSMKIAKRIITDCGGELLVRPDNPYNHEVFFWVPMEVVINDQGEG